MAKKRGKSHGDKDQRRPATGVPKRLAGVWPSDLKFQSVRDLFFPNDRGSPEFPARDWPPGSTPPNLTRLDCFIQKLQGAPAARRLRPANELARLGIECPFYEARVGTMLAVQYPNLRTLPNNENRHHQSKLKQLEKKSETLNRELSSFLLTLSKSMISIQKKHEELLSELKKYEESPFGSTNGYSNYRSDGLATSRYLAALAEISNQVAIIGNDDQTLFINQDMARRSKRLKVAGSENSLLQFRLFATTLGFVWKNLTGEDPVGTFKSEDDHDDTISFGNFVKSAWLSCARPKTKKRPSWEHCIKSAVATVPKGKWERLETKYSIDPMGYEHSVFAGRLWLTGPAIDQFQLWTPAELRRRDDVRAEKISRWHKIIADTRSDNDTANDQVAARYFLAVARAYWFGPKCEEILRSLDISRTFADDEFQPPPLDLKY